MYYDGAAAGLLSKARLCGAPPGVHPGAERAGDKVDALGDDVDNQIQAELTEFIATDYLFGDITRAPRDDRSLVEEGIIDSTGILELIEFLEQA